MASSSKRIHLTEFKKELPFGGYREFPSYKVDWLLEGKEWKKVAINIKEYCFVISLCNGVCIKIYSSVDRVTDVSREKGEDSIKTVAATEEDLKPVRGKFTHTYRIEGWQHNFRKHLREILESLGNNTGCLCGGEMEIKYSSKTKHTFLGCENYKINNCKTRSLVAVI